MLPCIILVCIMLFLDRKVELEQLERLVGPLTFELGAAKELSALLSSRYNRNGR